MSVIWKIDLFVKPTIEKPDEAWCKVCEKFLKLSDRSPRNLELHLHLHPDYAAKFKELKKKDESQKNAMDKFVTIQPKGIV